MHVLNFIEFRTFFCMNYSIVQHKYGWFVSSNNSFNRCFVYMKKISLGVILYNSIQMKNNRIRLIKQAVVLFFGCLLLPPFDWSAPFLHVFTLSSTRVWCIMYGVWCVVYGVSCMVYHGWCIMDGVWCIMYSVWCIMYGVWWIMFGV